MILPHMFDPPIQGTIVAPKERDGIDRSYKIPYYPRFG